MYVCTKRETNYYRSSEIRNSRDALSTGSPLVHLLLSRGDLDLVTERLLCGDEEDERRLNNHMSVKRFETSTSGRIYARHQGNSTISKGRLSHILHETK